MKYNKIKKLISYFLVFIITGCSSLRSDIDISSNSYGKIPDIEGKYMDEKGNEDHIFLKNISKNLFKIDFDDNTRFIFSSIALGYNERKKYYALHIKNSLKRKCDNCAMEEDSTYNGGIFFMEMDDNQISLFEVSEKCSNKNNKYNITIANYEFDHKPSHESYNKILSYKNIRDVHDFLFNCLKKSKSKSNEMFKIYRDKSTYKVNKKIKNIEKEMNKFKRKLKTEKVGDSELIYND